jgi:uncharacterized membrane protein (UPF0127 family)
MKDMLFPIDVIWLNSGKIVTYIKQNFSPETYTKKRAEKVFSPEPDTLYVIEVPAGDADRLGITVGSSLAF